MKARRITALLVLVFFLVPTFALAKSIYKVGDKDQKIAAVQQLLTDLGMKADRSDGVFSKKTEKAIKKFQKKHQKTYKLKATGLLDDATYQAIMREAESIGTKGGKKALKNPKAGEIIKTASRYQGVPYKFGGTDAKGFDCSGYVSHVFSQHSVNLTRMVDTQFKEGQAVQKKNLQAGDLVFFETYEKGASHVGIYAGNGKFWHASSSKGVMLSGLEEDYWKKRYLGARRILK